MSILCISLIKNFGENELVFFVVKHSVGLSALLATSTLSCKICLGNESHAPLAPIYFSQFKRSVRWVPWRAISPSIAFRSVAEGYTSVSERRLDLAVSWSLSWDLVGCSRRHEFHLSCLRFRIFILCFSKWSRGREWWGIDITLGHRLSSSSKPWLFLTIALWTLSVI